MTPDRFRAMHRRAQAAESRAHRAEKRARVAEGWALQWREWYRESAKETP